MSEKKILRLRGKDKTPIADVYLTKGDRTFHAVNNLLVGIVILVVLLPMLNVLASSFSSAAAVNSGRVYLWPVEFDLVGYKKVFTYPNIWRSYGNTFFYTVAGTAINIVMTMLAAYPLSRRGLPFKGFLISCSPLPSCSAAA